MKLSFVIPAYNEEKYVGDCLDAIIKQKTGLPYDIEIIVVNNASTDGTADVVKKYKEVKLVTEMKKGLVAARRAGFLAATGDLIANVDADTRLTPGWIVRVMNEFAKDDKLVALSGPFIYYDVSWDVTALTHFFYYVGFGMYLINRFVFRVGSMLQGGNFIVRKDALEKIGGYSTNLDFYGEDADVARRMNKVGKVKFTFRLPIYSSGRRLAKEGSITMGVRYSLNYLSIIFFQKPFSKTSIDVRLENPNAGPRPPEHTFKKWLVALSVTVIFLALTIPTAFILYSLAETGTISAVNFIRFKLQAQEEAQDVQTGLRTLSSSTKNVLQEKWNEIEQ